MKMILCLTLFSFSGFATEINLKDLVDSDVSSIRPAKAPKYTFVGPPKLVLFEPETTTFQKREKSAPRKAPLYPTLPAARTTTR